MKSILAILILNAVLAILAVRGNAQTVSPVITECGRKCVGEFTVTNPGVRPLFVTVQPYSFSLNPATGKSIFRPLDPTASVQLGEMAARIGPQAQHTFSYRIQCKQPTPCLVTLYAEITGGHTDTGLAVRVLLPSVVYVCDKQKKCRANVRKEAGLAD